MSCLQILKIGKLAAVDQLASTICLDDLHGRVLSALTTYSFGEIRIIPSTRCRRTGDTPSQEPFVDDLQELVSVVLPDALGDLGSEDLF